MWWKVWKLTCSNVTDNLFLLNERMMEPISPSKRLKEWSPKI